MPLLPEAKNCDPSVKKNFRKISAKLGYTAIPPFASITLTDLTASTLVSANASKTLESVTIGTGLDYTRPTLSLSHLGIESLIDAGADKAMFWDDSASACKWLGMGNSIAITDVTLDTIQDIRTSASPAFAGLTSTGTIDASAGEVLTEDNATVEPAGKSDGYIGVAVVGGRARIYFAVEGNVHYCDAEIPAVSPTTGNPIGLLLLFTYV